MQHCRVKEKDILKMGKSDDESAKTAFVSTQMRKVLHIMLTLIFSLCNTENFTADNKINREQNVYSLNTTAGGRMSLSTAVASLLSSACTPGC